MRSIRSGQSCTQGESNRFCGFWGLLVVRVVVQTASMRPEKLGAGTASKMANGKREGWEIRNCFATVWADPEGVVCMISAVCVAHRQGPKNIKNAQETGKIRFMLRQEKTGKIVGHPGMFVSNCCFA